MPIFFPPAGHPILSRSPDPRTVKFKHHWLAQWWWWQWLLRGTRTYCVSGAIPTALQIWPHLLIPKHNEIRSIIIPILQSQKGKWKKLVTATCINYMLTYVDIASSLLSNSPRCWRLVCKETCAVYCRWYNVCVVTCRHWQWLTASFCLGIPGLDSWLHPVGQLT